MASKLMVLLSVVGLMAAIAVSGVTSSYYDGPYDVLSKGFTAYNVLIRQGANSTSGYNTVRSATPTQAQPLGFGDYYTFDMPLLSAQDVNSTLLGRVQGHYAFVQQTGDVVFVTETFVVNNGASLGGINGTFSAIGLEYIGINSSKPIVGGTSDFEFVTGIATTHPLSSELDSNGNLVLWFMYNFKFKA